MKRLVSLLLAVALITGLVPGFASFDAAAADNEIILTISCTSGVKVAVESMLTTEGKDLTDFTGLELGFAGKALSTADWAYLREIFDDNDNLKTFILSGAVETIPACSDDFSPKWEDVTLPESLKSIGNNAFRKSSELETIFIPKSVTSIGTLAFAGCISLTDIEIDSDNSIYKNLNDDGVVYANSYKNLHTYPAGKTDVEYTIPFGVTSLGIGSFADVKIEDLTISTGVTSITDAFVKTPGVESYAMYNIYFNRSSPPSLTLGGRSSYEQDLDFKAITIYVPAPSVNAYKNSSSYKKFNDEIEINGDEDAEILGLDIKGTVGVGSFADTTPAPGGDDDDDDDDEPYSVYTGNAHINLLTETLDIDIQITINGRAPVTFVVEGFSLNGGSSWIAGDLTNERLAAAFKSSTTIKLSNRFDTEKRKPETDSDIITFPTIQGRPSSNPNKLKLFYTVDKWGLVSSYSDTDFIDSMSDYSYVVAVNGKLPDNAVWSNKLPADGLDIEDYPPKGVKKTVYYLRADAYMVDGTASADAKYYPNGKPWKVTPATRSKTPKYKVNYKKEIIKIKKGDAINGTGGTAKFDFSVTDLLDNGVTSVEIAKLPTGKKPGSMTQTLELAKRGTLDKSSFIVQKGRIKDKELKYYEFSTDGTTWKRIPKFSSSSTVYIRKKQNAKVKKGVLSGDAASDYGVLTVTWDVYDTEKNKSGIVSAVVSAVPPGGTTSTD